MESLSKKYILTDEWGRPIPKLGCYGHDYCLVCGDFFVKKTNKHICCSRKCIAYHNHRMTLERKIEKAGKLFVKNYKGVMKKLSKE